VVNETRICQNCKQRFAIESGDSAFYEKMQVPPPTFCPDCRLQRRMAFRNERTLYKRKCEAPGHSEEVISVFSADNPQRVYDQEAWWSDSWDPMAYGREPDFVKPLIPQIMDLWKEVPDIALMNNNCVNSEYCSITEENKNCYLVIGGDFNENSSYSSFIFHCKETLDCHWVSKSEFCYESLDCISCSRLFFSQFCEGCYESAFLFNCKNCHDCFGCTNLNNKSYCIWNVQYSKEDYETKIKEFDLGSSAAIFQFRERAKKEQLLYPRRFARVLRSVNATGDNIEGGKNCKRSFEIFDGAEDCAYLWLIYSKVRDCYDTDHSGLSSELCCDSSTIYPGSRILFSRFIRSCKDTYYSYNCHNCSDIFGCVGLRNKKYCVLNKQYSEKEYRTLVPKLVAHMNSAPYIDTKGRIYKYGEFFPVELSPFAYNETVSQELFPLTKGEAAARGYQWREPEKRDRDIANAVSGVPDHIKDTDDSILSKIIKCAHADSHCSHQCTKAFRPIASELQFYKHVKIAFPRLCPNCRHYERIVKRNPLKLWHRKCMCGGTQSKNYANAAPHFHKNNPCGNEFETTYAPDRPEIVYCEQCYQAEVV